MPPAGKGKGKKTRGSFSSSHTRHDRLHSSVPPRSRSRNSSPSSTTAVSDITAFSDTTVLGYNDLVDKYLSTSSEIPQSTTLLALQSDLTAIQNANKGKAAKVKERLASIRETISKKREEGARREREREEARRRVLSAAAVESDEDRRTGTPTPEPGTIVVGKIKKKEKGSSVSGGGKNGSTGAGGELKKKKRKAESPLRDDARSSSGASPRKKPRASPTLAIPASEYPPPPPYDPLAPDDTIYEIEEVTPETTVEERCKIYRVGSFPMIDLKPYQPGIPPDEDFSKAKPANQVTLNAFNTMTEPFFRHFTEEDEAFLRERGDRVTPYIMPPLGRRYKEVWAEQDGSNFASPAPALPPPNEPRGNPDLISDDQLEKEDVSVGPLLSRVLAAMIAEEKSAEAEKEEKDKKEKEEKEKDKDKDKDKLSGDGGEKATLPSSSTALPPLADPSLKLPPSHKTDYPTLEQRLILELKHLGLLAPTASDPNWKERQDDEVSARLRLLQAQLHRVAVMTGARKARLEDLLQPQLAYQEYITIHEDLDKQVEQAYSKRTRTIKAKKKKLPAHLSNGNLSAQQALLNAAGGGGGRGSIGDAAKSLMEKRAKWHNGVGPVFDEGITRLPRESVFGNLEELIRGEEEMMRLAMEAIEGGEEEG